MQSLVLAASRGGSGSFVVLAGSNSTLITVIGAAAGLGRLTIATSSVDASFSGLLVEVPCEVVTLGELAAFAVLLVVSIPDGGPTSQRRFRCRRLHRRRRWVRCCAFRCCST